MNSKELKEKSLEELIQLIKKGDISEPNLLTYALDTAVTDKEVNITGNFFGIYLATDPSVSVKVRFNSMNSPQYTLTQGIYFVRPFDKIFITWTSQSGKSIDIISSALASDIFQIVDNRSEQWQTTYLQNIAAQLQGQTTAGTDAEEGTVGTAAVLAIAANASRHGCSIHADLGNSGTIYIGFTDQTTNTRKIAALKAGDFWSTTNYRGNVYLYGSAAGQKYSPGEW